VARRVLLFVGLVAVVAAGVLGVSGATAIAVAAGGAQAAGGALDRSFGSGGRVLTDLGGHADDEGYAGREGLESVLVSSACPSRRLFRAR
jgi:hypothetical protein